MSGPLILVVDDEFLIRLTLADALANDGFAVLEAADGEDALRILAATPGVAVLLTDLHLPGGMDGTEVARRARLLRRDLPVIYMTGQPGGPPQPASPRDAFIAKPYLPSEVCAAVRRTIGG